MAHIREKFWEPALWGFLLRRRLPGHPGGEPPRPRAVPQPQPGQLHPLQPSSRAPTELKARRDTGPERERSSALGDVGTGGGGGWERGESRAGGVGPELLPQMKRQEKWDFSSKGAEVEDGRGQRWHRPWGAGCAAPRKRSSLWSAEAGTKLARSWPKAGPSAQRVLPFGGSPGKAGIALRAKRGKERYRDFSVGGEVAFIDMSSAFFRPSVPP